tara:strand:+ start:953 stop:1435 length:483 start_codon:yes stop_codon:yes gene_type:complete
MKKSSKPLIFLCALFLTFYAQTALVSLSESADEFTDEVSYTLSFIDDSESSALGFQCNNTRYAFVILPDGMFESDSYVDVQFRFDKNEPFSKSMSITNYKSAGTRNKSTISELLSKIKSSDSFIVKVGSENVQRFSGITTSGVKEIDRFIELSSKVSTCT